MKRRLLKMDPNEDPEMEPGKSKKEKKSRKSKSDSRKSGSRKSKKKASSQEAEDYSDEDYDRQEGDDDWPYKKSYAVDERKSKSKKEKGLAAPKRAKSDDEYEMDEKNKRSSKTKRKSKSSSRRSKDHADYDDEVSEEEEDLHSEEEDEARARRRPKRHSSGRHRRSDSDHSSGGYQDGDSFDDYSDEFSEDASYYSDDDEAYSSELDGSIASDGTYDSAEEYEEYGGMPPETPAMMNYNQEINDLMQKANPERTDHLMNRVNRQKGNVTYDQNMPMMTRQALMTRQASAQAHRQRVDANSVDRSRLGFRNESFHGKNNGGQKPVRRGPGGKRAPPRSKSSGLGTMAMATRRGGDDGGADDPRARFRGRGASTSMQRYSNKPNNVARMSSNRRGGEMDRSGHRSSRGEPRRGNVGRAKSTTALSKASADPQKPIRRQPRRTTKEERQKANEVTDDSEYSSEESDSDGGPTRSRPKRRVKKIVNKQDMSIRKHRRKLHGMMYKIKMSVDMSDLMKEVKKGEIPKDPILSLLMDEP